MESKEHSADHNGGIETKDEPMNGVEQQTDKEAPYKMWDPVRDGRPPAEGEFSQIEKAFCRFVNFLRHRDEAGLSPEAVRLLHNFYMELDSAASPPATDEEDPSASGPKDIYVDLPINQLGSQFHIRKQLESRHLNVLVNLIMLMVEAEQKEVQQLLKFYSALTESTDNGEVQGPLHALIRTYNPDKLVELKALTQEHIRLKVDFIAKIKTGRALMVKCLEGSNRLLLVLRKKAAKQQRRENKEEMTRFKQSMAPPPETAVNK